MTNHPTPEDLIAAARRAQEHYKAAKEEVLRSTEHLRAWRDEQMRGQTVEPSPRPDRPASR